MTSAASAFARSPRFSVAFEGPDGPMLLAHRVSLAEAIGLVLSRGAADVPPREIASVRELSADGLVCQPTKLGAFRPTEGVQGLEHAPFRRRAVLAWGCVPPVHDEAYGVLLDHEAEGAPETGTLAAWPLGEALLEEVLALVPPKSRAFRASPRAAVPRLAIPVARLLALRGVKGVLLARDLAVPTAMEARGGLRSRYRGLVFEVGRSLDALLGVLDEEGMRWSRRGGSAPLFEVAGVVSGHTFHMRLVERAELGGPAATVFAPELGVVLPWLASRLGARDAGRGATREAWLREALTAEIAPEPRIAEGLVDPSALVRSHALEAAWLAMTPGTLALLGERASTEPEEALRSLIATTVALLAPGPPDEGASATALRKASDLGKRRRLEGLEELAARQLRAEDRAAVRERLAEVHTNADDRDARFVAGLLAWLTERDE